ncbi:MAG TPA: hypothetical protein RMH26_15640, partial [Polyangiaceae bacterium LLY-WYZ-15_(1-7)]|nr:hypothetical protein [Polyangiaceae bacterium LLY-WYZ-15_(1-7)]
MRFVLPLLLCLGACGGAQAAPVTAAPVTAAPPSAPALPDADPGAPTEALLALWESDEDPARCPALLERLAEAPPEGAARLARAGRAALACEAPARARALLAASLREADACLPRVQLAAALRTLGNAPAAEAQLRATRRAHPRCVEAPLAQARLL